MRVSTHSVKRSLTVIGVLVASVVTSAVAQQPLVTPNYYLFQLPALSAGQELSGELTTDDGQNFKDGSRLDMYGLVVRQGETVTLRVVSPAFEPVLSVFDPTGALVAYNDFGESFGDVSTSFVAGSSGRHVVVVSGWSDYDLGEYVLSTGRATGGPEAASSVELPASIESAITSEMAPAPGAFGGGAEYFSFEITEELLFLANMVSFDLDPVLTLYDQDGNIIATNDDDGFTTDSLLVALLAPGSYVLAASTYYAGESGEYSLTLETYYRR